MSKKSLQDSFKEFCKKNSFENNNQQIEIINLLDKLGEKISTQHILKTISITEDDYNYSFEKIKKLYNITKNDPFIFDSLAIVSKNKYKNHSGTFINISPNNIKPNILKELKKMDVNNISNPVSDSDLLKIIKGIDLNDPFNIFILSKNSSLS